MFPKLEASTNKISPVNLVSNFIQTNEMILIYWSVISKEITKYSTELEGEIPPKNLDLTNSQRFILFQIKISCSTLAQNNFSKILLIFTKLNLKFDRANNYCNSSKIKDIPNAEERHLP